MIIRSFNEKDIQSVVELLQSCRPFVFPHDEYLYWVLTEYYPSTSFVCEDSGCIVGFVSGLQSVEQSTIFVWQICIHPAHRRKGLGSRLLKSLFDRIVEDNLDNMQLSITKENLSSYQLFENFAAEHSLTMELLKTVHVSGSSENVYRICR